MGRVYATAADYQAYSGQTPPADIDRQLARASELLDSDVLMTAWYNTDPVTGLPTDTTVAAAFSSAACAQVEFWTEGPGEDVDISGPIQGATIGSVSIQYGAGSNGGAAATIAPRVYRALLVLPSTVFRVAVGSPGWGVW